MQAETGTTLTGADAPDAPAAGSEPAPTARRALFWAVLGIAALWVALDQVTKWWAEQSLTRGEPVSFIPGFMDLHLVYNPGAAFSLATNATGLLTAFALAVVIYLVFAARKLGSIGWTVALALLLGGATGNLIDRFFREPGPGQGHVVDFLRFTNFPVIDFPVFNVADIGVTSAAILIAILALRGISPDGRRHGDDDEPDDDVEPVGDEPVGDEPAGDSDAVDDQARDD